MGLFGWLRKTPGGGDGKAARAWREAWRQAVASLDAGALAPLESALRAERPPVIARIENERLLLDLRTVPPEQDDHLAALVTSAASGLFP